MHRLLMFGHDGLYLRLTRDASPMLTVITICISLPTRYRYLQYPGRLKNTRFVNAKVMRYWQRCRGSDVAMDACSGAATTSCRAYFPFIARVASQVPRPNKPCQDGGNNTPLGSLSPKFGSWVAVIIQFFFSLSCRTTCYSIVLIVTYMYR